MLIKSGPLNLEISNLIGEGAFGKVYLAKDLSSNQKYAIKIVETSKMSQKAQELFNNEKKILRIATANNFRNIIKIQNIVKEETGKYYIILEYCNGGSLHKSLYDYYKKNRKPFPEEYVSYLMKEILLGVKSLHDHGIIHRDLKLDNILLNYKSKINCINQNILSAEVKITDFNVSYFPNASKPITFLGTFPDISPTILQNGLKIEESKPYDEKVDIWSLGTLCYEMLFAKTLFGNRVNKEMLQNILSANFTIEKTISPQARSFLYSMLKREGIYRASVSELLNHEFIRGNNYTLNLKNYPKINIFNNNIYETQNFYNYGCNNYNYLDISHYTTNIVFRDLHFMNLINILTTDDIKISDLIKSYFLRINRPDLINNYYKGKVKFIFNGKNLITNEFSRESIKEVGLMNGSNIQVIYAKETI